MREYACTGRSAARFHSVADYPSRPRLYTGWSIVGRKLRKRKLAGVTVTGADVGHVLPRRRRCGSVISNAERGWGKGMARFGADF